MKIKQLTLLSVAFTAALFAGCQLTEKDCDPDQIVEYGICAPPPVGGDGDGDGDGTGGDDGEGGAGGGAGAPGDGDGDTDPPMDDPNFGDSCTEGGDECKGGTVCAAPQLPICTQVYCGAGEANEGACPDSMTCSPTGQADPPTICL